MCDEQFDENVELALKHNVFIETAHLPYRNVCNNLWALDSVGEEYLENTIMWIKRIAKAGIKTAVIHTATSKTPPAINEIGIERLRKIVKSCEEENVTLAMENVHFWEYVLVPLSIIKSDNLGICLDFGHANCFTKDIYEIKII